MKRIFWHLLAAFAAGFCLRLFFVLKFPASSGDTVLYEQMAVNWLKHGVYAMDVNGAIQPVDLRMPGYPAYLVLVYWLTSKTAAAAYFWVMLGQVFVDLLSIFFIVWLAGLLLLLGDKHARQMRALIAATWLAALCPFTANYTAVPLTESFAVALTAIALVTLTGLCGSIHDLLFPAKRQPWEPKNEYWHWAAPLGFVVGIGTLFRPETPLLLLAAWIGTAFQLLRRGKSLVWIRIVAYSGFACVLPLLPWAARNAVTLHEIQFLAPKNSNLPGELVPSGFMAWEKTWLFRMRDCYLAPWKLNGEAIEVDQLPARAFDSPEEKERVAMILDRYNEELALTKEEDDAFAQVARERTARHPLRTYVLLPALRAVTMWFAPRIELLPVSGTVFPLAQAWEDDKLDQSVTAGLFLINIFYVGLGAYGAIKLWRWGAASRAAVLIIVLFVAMRTAFLTTLETPEPRYVLECFPAVIALGAAGLAGRKYEEKESEAGIGVSGLQTARDES
ncbi:MAG TPA: hypothetical protein VJO16_12745 [Candidatus Acidoferrum sp.]|nr:hypothetical protein [Candidatus Acidoferrum sp.]